MNIALTVLTYSYLYFFGDLTIQLKDLREVRMVEGFKNRFRIFFHDSKRKCIEMSSQSADVCVMWMDLIEKQRLRMNDIN